MTPQILGLGTAEVRQHLSLPACPRCGDSLVAAEASELVGRGHIRNSWSCDSCGHAFVTAVQLSSGAGFEDDAD